MQRVGQGQGDEVLGKTPERVSSEASAVGPGRYCAIELHVYRELG